MSGRSRGWGIDEESNIYEMDSKYEAEVVIPKLDIGATLKIATTARMNGKACEWLMSGIVGSGKHAAESLSSSSSFFSPSSDSGRSG